ncbi:putative protein-disulfide isomerase [Nitrosomonas sp. PY1]|uniref:DsbA family protein n=1 Tax=Nitrosomonas sp. PY1 TaxID=1803906 RepID=UPI001FC8DA17|nr:DsbA family protein [Nitrosomonas sp. PY1]GKS70392.1 putative protein-disulfide isomerase [Nitrosomonas sp. PY1]
MARLIYIHDPMCSWCYAFTQSWTKLQETLPANIPIINIVGGLASDTTEPMPLHTREMVQQAWKRIEQTIPGISFNWDFWAYNTPYRSTYLACRAVLAAKKQRHTSEVEMIRAIQTAYYQKAKNPSLPETLQECAREIGLDETQFARDLTSVEIDSELHKEIQSARDLGVNSYPSLRLQHNNNLHMITIDYRDHRTMLQQINSIIQGL